MRLINTNLLNYFYKIGIKPLKESLGKLDKKIDVLDTKEEIQANTDAEKMAGALALKEMYDEINSNLTNLFKEVSGTATNDSIASNELTSISITLNIPSGYKIHSIKQLYITGWSGLVYQGHRISGNTLTVQIYNTRTTAKPCTVTAYVNCIKT